MLEACRASDAVLLCAVGGPKWDTTDPDTPRPEQGLLGLRKGLGLFANLRPVRPSQALLDASPLRRERIEGTDLLVVRELTGGIYFGESGRDGDRAHDDCAYTVEEIERIARVAFEAAGERRGKVTSVDKANVLETSRLWRETVTRLAAEYEGVELDHLLVDNAAMQLVSRPAEFDVIVTENLFGDILSDEAAMLTGSLGMLPSASLGEGGPGLYEPVHGSAPDIAGKGNANPLATLLSVAMMLRYGLDLHDEARPAGEGGREGPGRRPAHPRPGRRDAPRRQMTDAVLAALCPIVHTEPTVEKAELIWKNGEFVPWDEANVHVLSHGLHYGTGVFEGIRCYDTEIGARRSSATRTTSTGSPSPPSSTTCRSTHSARGDPRGDQGADPPQRPAQLLHPPARLPRLRRDGPVREERAGRRDHRRLALGRLPGRGGQAATASAPRSPPGGGSRPPA